MALHVKDQEIPRRQRVQKGETGEGSMVVKKGYGNECSLMIAVRAPGYHTKPHAHESEQINYVLEGEIWFFVEDRGFHCQTRGFPEDTCQQDSLGVESLEPKRHRRRGACPRADWRPERRGGRGTL